MQDFGRCSCGEARGFLGLAKAGPVVGCRFCDARLARERGCIEADLGPAYSLVEIRRDPVASELHARLHAGATGQGEG